MPDILLTLADALVADLAAAFPTLSFGGQTYPITAAWPDDASIELTDDALRNPLVWVIDAGDRVETERGECCEDYSLLLIVQQKIPLGISDAAAFARALSGLAASIRDRLKSRDTALELSIGGSETVCCHKAERTVARNHDEWHHRRRFFSEILTTWRRY